LTPKELAPLLRMGEDRIRGMIKRGELGAINTASALCGKPRFIVLPHHLAEFERRRSAAPPPKPPRRRRRKADDEIVYFED
jgi:hypothetical protein